MEAMHQVTCELLYLAFRHIHLQWTARIVQCQMCCARLAGSQALLKIGAKRKDQIIVKYWSHFFLLCFLTYFISYWIILSASLSARLVGSVTCQSYSMLQTTFIFRHINFTLFSSTELPNTYWLPSLKEALKIRNKCVSIKKMSMDLKVLY